MGNMKKEKLLKKLLLDVKKLETNTMQLYREWIIIRRNVEQQIFSLHDDMETETYKNLSQRIIEIVLEADDQWRHFEKRVTNVKKIINDQMNDSCESA